MSRPRRHRRHSSPDDIHWRSMVKGISMAAGLVMFAMLGVFLVLQGFVK